ncbi:MAG TPA: PAS domain S-box protein [Anaeromyxobacteraceae bacterium]|nr:PAS domain S-box protein [Anaeromyxobacteraceae bacterium]
MSEDITRSIVQTSADAILSCDAEGVIRLWNSGAERIFGFTAEEAIGKSLDIIVPERLRARHWDGWKHALAVGKSRYGAGELLAVPAIRKDGSTLSIEFTIGMIKDASGGVTAVAAIIRDVTARWQKEKELRARLKELEARAVAAT